MATLRVSKQGSGDQSETSGEQSAPEEHRSPTGKMNQSNLITQRGKPEEDPSEKLNQRATPEANLRPQKLRPQRKHSILNSSRPWNNG